MHSSSRILTTHVGSLIRPPELIEVLARMQEGRETDDGTLQAALVEAVGGIVKSQAETGLDIVSDGEFSKTRSWSRYIMGRLNGVRQSDDLAVSPTARGKDRRDFREFYAEYEATAGPIGLGRQQRSGGELGSGGWIIEGPISYTGHARIQEDIVRMKAALATAQVCDGFLAAVAPFSAYSVTVNHHYAGEADAVMAFAEALHEEYKAIVDSGLMVQIDDAYLPIQYDIMVPPHTLGEYRDAIRVGIEALNHALRGIPAERVRYHVCWGSWNGPHASDVNARDIIDLILKVPSGHYSLEMANPRHEHEWRVWESTKLPEGAVLMPGVISHATNIIEHPELVAERIVRLAKLVGRENVIASTDCGFAQGPFARRVHPSIMWAKLASLVEGAQLATMELWPG